MAQFSVFLTALESKMLAHTVANPSDWIDNLVEWRVRIAQDDYLPTAIEQLKASGATSIPASRDAIILAVDLPPKDPNWTPVERDDPNDDLTVEYTFDLEDDDIKMLAWMYENPHTHIRDWIAERTQIAIKEKADTIFKELLTDPTWTDPIPTDPAALIDLVELKSAAQHLEETRVAMLTMTAALANTTGEPYLPPTIPFMTYKHHK
jgi:hypothetical protein